MSVFTDKRILLGVSGSIAAYKAADLASKLSQAGAQVDVLLTAAAERFVTALTFQSVSGRRAYTDADLWGSEAHVLHVQLAKQADLFVIAPCTANTLAKLSAGISDNLLSIAALAAQSPLLLAPAMDGGMYDSPATQENLARMKQRGAAILGPARGHLASGLVGAGRMLEPAELFGHIRLALGRNGKLKGKKIVVTAGGTQEALDPARVLTNHSSGKQGYALAQAALDAGAQVCLISAPACLTPPIGAQVIHIRSAEELRAAVLAESADGLVMSAAAADFRPKHVAADKMKKRDGIPLIELESAPDILKAVAEVNADKSRYRVVVGFAAESRDLLENAREKLEAKRLDFIAANDISAADAGFGVETNRLTLLFRDGSALPLPLMSKSEAAEKIIEHLAKRLE